MSNPTADDEEKRYRIAEQIKATATKLEGIRLEHFVDNHNLCTHCKHATVARQSSRNNVFISCSIFKKMMPDDITQCSDYGTVTQLSLSQMADIAVLIDNRTDRKGGYL